ncbi:MAG: hypothetical protein ACTHN0_04195 [Aquihabitans sp.]
MARRLAAALLVVWLAIAALAGCGSDEGTKAERAKAEQLQAELDAAGVDDGIDVDTAVSLYGDDGGKVCAIAEDPAAMEREGLLAHPRFALRKTEVDPDAVAYTKAVIEVYCPAQLGNVEEYIEGLRVDDAN